MQKNFAMFASLFYFEEEQQKMELLCFKIQEHSWDREGEEEAGTGEAGAAGCSGGSWGHSWTGKLQFYEIKVS